MFNHIFFFAIVYSMFFHGDYSIFLIFITIPAAVFRRCAARAPQRNDAENGSPPLARASAQACGQNKRASALGAEAAWRSPQEGELN